MTAFGCVPRASVCPCARCVEAKTSPSSIACADADRDRLLADRDVQEARAARRRGTAPRPSPRSAGSGASRAGSRAASPRCSARFFSTFATAPAVYVLRREPRRTVARVGAGLPEGWRTRRPAARAAGAAKPPTGPRRCSARPSRTAPARRSLRFARRATAARPAPTASRACWRGSTTPDRRHADPLRAPSRPPARARAGARHSLADVLGHARSRLPVRLERPPRAS